MQVKIQPPGGALLSTGPHLPVAFSLKIMDFREGERSLSRTDRKILQP